MPVNIQGLYLISFITTSSIYFKFFTWKYSNY